MKCFRHLALPAVLLMSAAVFTVGCESQSGGDEGSTSTTANAASGTVTGAWKGQWTRASDGLTGTFDMSLSQNGNVLTGSYSDDGGWQGAISGTINASTRKMDFHINYTTPAGRVETWQGTAADSNMNAASGTWNCAADSNHGTWSADKD